MGTTIQLTAKDGHKLDVYKAEPKGKAKGAVVVIQEIFGVNGNIRRIADQYAAAGYVAVAPALFDRVGKGIDLGYGPDDFAKGRESRGKLTDDGIVADVQAAIDEAGKSGKVGIVGYCFGGTVVWMAACRCSGLSAASAYYGGQIVQLKDESPKVPVQCHFGDKDGGIPLSAVHEIKQTHPDIPTFVYDDAGHGFCCDDRDSYNPGACQRARERTLALFGQHVG
jgi:carboxymethylenebutenolidase